jgi:hypothetical protein
LEATCVVVVRSQKEYLVSKISCFVVEVAALLLTIGGAFTGVYLWLFHIAPFREGLYVHGDPKLLVVISIAIYLWVTLISGFLGYTFGAIIYTLLEIVIEKIQKSS